MFRGTRAFNRSLPTLSRDPARLVPAARRLCQTAFGAMTEVVDPRDSRDDAQGPPAPLFAAVRSLPGENHMTIHVCVGGRERRLERPKDEPLERPLARLLTNLIVPGGKKARKTKAGDPRAAVVAPQSAVARPIAEVFDPVAGAALDPHSVANEAAWKTGNLLRLGDTEFAVVLNPPSIRHVELYGQPFAGVPIVPRVDLSFASEDMCEWRWELQRAPGEAWVAPRDPGRRRGRSFMPSEEDVGSLVRVRCRVTERVIPGAAAKGVAGVASTWTSEAAATSDRQVVPLPEPAPGVTRALWAADPEEMAAARTGSVGGLPSETTGATASSPRSRASNNVLRVATYNILADQYASTDRARDELFAHCPPQFLAPTYRRPLVLAQLLDMRTDIVCLQEVDESAYRTLLEPGLGAWGYRGVFTNKAGAVREGEATFYSAERFALRAAHDVVLRDAMESAARGARGSEIAAFLQDRAVLRHALGKVGTIGQILVLEPRPGGEDAPPLPPLCVINTHLFFHADAPHIRTLHTWALFQEARAFVESLGLEREPAVLFCGDLNSDLNDGLPGNLELLKKGRIGADYWDWAYVHRFSWSKADETVEQGDGLPHAKQPVSPPPSGETERAVESTPRSQNLADPPRHGLTLELGWPPRLCPAGDLKMPFSNHVRGYSGLLDYIWYDGRAFQWEPTANSRAADRLSMEAMTDFLPNRGFPSDHLPVVHDLHFVGNGEPRDGDTDAKEKARVVGGSENADPPGVLRPAALWAVSDAVERLSAGATIAIPTDTLYGLAASARSGEAVARIYAIKGRRENKPLAVAVADVDAVEEYADVTGLPAGLLEALLPGAVTVVLRRRPDGPLAPGINPGSAALGVRIPDHPFVRAVARQLGGALALTSANRSGGRSSVRVDEFEDLWPMCGAVYDGGTLDRGRAGSTVVDLAVPGKFTITREGVDVGRVRDTLQAFGLQEVPPAA